jgi:peptidoglycan/LPS O-acetylase OafA/YrhL
MDFIRFSPMIFLGVEWSISTEFMFYMLLPFLFLWMNNSKNINHAIEKVGMLYIGSVLLYWLMFYKGGYLQALGGAFVSPVYASWSYFFIFTHLHAFVAGVAIWYLKNNEQTADSRQQTADSRQNMR